MSTLQTSTDRKSAQDTLVQRGAPDMLSSETVYRGFQCALNCFHLPKLEQPELTEVLISLPMNRLQFDARIENGVRRYDWHPGLAFIIPPGAAATYWYSAPALRFHLRLDEGRLARHAESRGIDPSSIAVRWSFATPDPQLKAIGDALHAELAAGMPSGRLYGEGIREAICAHVLATYATARAEVVRGGLSSNVLKRVLEFMEDRLDENLSIDVLASQAGYSPWHFQRLFRKSLGTPVHTYVVGRRVKKALTLLARGESYAEAAIQVGFSSSHQLKHWLARVESLPM